ncbi:transporter substrate-binding domain-containing protein [Thalassobaculum sp. OXR-137]|uniref:substrate-binding periplasmic protein n=1 Tax=Thalassobaculum sp. OXR-137 TaxID=3100173 RepID=UPI002AC8FD56|nr:transporter substrate-binding domain-containing protein [Thalassobaculum sp. OXR-137]WPZ35296.1 transporter substrate-binding domain-containing protein [Thalassobaculum sp. OXR-137]
MRYGLIAGLLLAVAALLGVSGPAKAEPPATFAGRPTLTFVYETEANPPRYLGKGTAINWDRPGLTLDLLRELGSRLQVNLVLERFPWNRGLYLVETGEADGIFHASYKKERERIGVYPKTADGAVDPTRAIFTQAYYLHVLRGSPVRWDGTTLSGLGDKPVGATAGYSVVGDLEAMGVPVETGKIQGLNLNKLVAGRIAAYAELENMAAAAIATDAAAYADVVKLEPPLIAKPYYLLLSHAFADRDPALAEAVFETIAEINADPAFQARASDYAAADASR